jgi:hypothetical protein
VSFFADLCNELSDGMHKAQSELSPHLSYSVVICQPTPVCEAFRAFAPALAIGAKPGFQRCAARLTVLPTTLSLIRATSSQLPRLSFLRARTRFQCAPGILPSPASVGVLRRSCSDLAADLQAIFAPQHKLIAAAFA